MTFKLQPIDYAFDALEPYIDAKTMEIHHTKHHQTYLDKLNETVEKSKELKGMSITDIIKNVDSLPKDIKKNARFFAGGVYNHDFFFGTLKKDVKLTGKIKEAIEKDFESYEKFVDEFTKQAMALQGSGWTWLVLDKKKLEIMNMKNQHNPLSKGLKPILGLDMWEHAYYLKHQNKKLDYIKSFFKVIDWKKVNTYYDSK